MRLDFSLCLFVLVALGVNAFAFEPRLAPSVEKIVKWSDLHVRAGLALTGKEDNGKQCALFITNRQTDFTGHRSKDVLVNFIEGKDLQTKADGTSFKFKPTGSMNLLASLRLQYDARGRLVPSSDNATSLIDSKASANTLMVRSTEDGFLHDKPYHFDNEVQIALDGKGNAVKAVAIDHTAKQSTTCNLN